MTTGPTRDLIAPLTGIRALAAFWVVLRHFRVELIEAFPALHILAPLMNVGYLGVDLFFILSGFILTYTHLDNLTDGYNWRKALGFLWLRIGRVWPLTVFVLLLFGLGFAAQILITGDEGFSKQIDVPRLIDHLLLIHAWYPHELDWNGLDWSVSAEWLAYLTFAVGVVVLGRFAAVASRRTLLIAIALLTLPMIIVGVSMQDDTILLFERETYTVLGGIVPIRVLTEFWAGALLAVLLRQRLREGRKISFPLPTITAASIVVILYVVAAFDPLRWTRRSQLDARDPLPGVDLIAATETIIVLPLFIVLIGALAVSRRDPLTWLLSTGPLVLGGKVSFALYLTHPLVLGVSLALLRLTPHGPLHGVLALLGLAAAWVFAWVLWRYVEEPSRRLARRMLPPTLKP